MAHQSRFRQGVLLARMGLEPHDSRPKDIMIHQFASSVLRVVLTMNDFCRFLIYGIVIGKNPSLSEPGLLGIRLLQTGQRHTRELLQNR